MNCLDEINKNGTTTSSCTANDPDDKVKQHVSDDDGSTGTIPVAEEKEALLAKVADLQEELQRQDREMEDLELDLKDALVSRQEAVNEVEHLQELLNDISGENDELVNDMQMLMEDNDELKQQVDERKAKYEQVSVELNEAKQEISELQESLDEERVVSGTTAQERAEELKHTKQTMDRKLRKSNEERQELERMVEELSEELEIMRDNMHTVLNEKKAALKRCKVLMNIMRSCSGQGTCSQLLAQVEAEAGDIEGLAYGGGVNLISGRGPRGIVGGIRNLRRNGRGQRASAGQAAEMMNGDETLNNSQRKSSRSLSLPGKNLFAGGRRSLANGVSDSIEELPVSGNAEDEQIANDLEEPLSRDNDGGDDTKASRALNRRKSRRQRNNDQNLRNSTNPGGDEKESKDAEAKESRNEAPVSPVPSCDALNNEGRNGRGILRVFGRRRGAAPGVEVDDESAIAASTSNASDKNESTSDQRSHSGQTLGSSDGRSFRSARTQGRVRQKRRGSGGASSVATVAGAWKEVVPHNMKHSRWGSKIFMDEEERRAISMAALGGSCHGLGESFNLPGEIVVERSSKTDVEVFPSSGHVIARDSGPGES